MYNKHSDYFIFYIKGRFYEKNGMTMKYCGILIYTVAP